MRVIEFAKAVVDSYKEGIDWGLELLKEEGFTDTQLKITKIATNTCVVSTIILFILVPVLIVKAVVKKVRG